MGKQKPWSYSVIEQQHFPAIIVFIFCYDLICLIPGVYTKNTVYLAFDMLKVSEIYIFERCLRSWKLRTSSWYLRGWAFAGEGIKTRNKKKAKSEYHFFKLTQVSTSNEKTILDVSLQSDHWWKSLRGAIIDGHFHWGKFSLRKG